jgi:hypothetical protein
MAQESASDLELAHRELREAREQLAAMSEVLQVISSSPGELGPVFQTILANAVRICEAKIGTLYIREGDGFRTVAVHNAPPAYVEARTRELIRPPPDATLGRVAATKQVVHIADIKDNTVLRRTQSLCGYPSRAWRLSDGARRPHAQGRRANRLDYHQSPGGVPIHR